MGVRIGHVAASAALALCASCGQHDESALPSPTQTGGMVVVVPELTPPTDPFEPAPPQVDLLLSKFVRAACEYDATLEHPRDFLARLDSLVTSNEFRRLATSQRANLDWPSLRARHERVAVEITGISLLTIHGPHMSADVEAIRTTHTSFADVRDFLHLEVWLVFSGSWRVDRATGGGL